MASDDDSVPDFVPFSDLRDVKLPNELATSRELVNGIAAAIEEAGGDQTKLLEQMIPALIGAVVGLEAQIATLRGRLAGG